MMHLQKFRHILKEGSWILLGQAMVMIGSLVGIRFLTELLNPAEYGELALGMTIATLANQTIFGPLSQGVLRFYAPAIEQGDIAGYLYAVRRLVLLTTLLLVGLILLGLTTLILVRQNQWAWVAIVSLLFANVTGYNSILNSIQSAGRQRAIVAMHQGMESCLRFLVAVLLVNIFGANSAIAMIGYTLGATVTIASQSVYFLKSAPCIDSWVSDKQVWQQKIWEYSWPFSIWGVFYWLQIVSDRWALGLFRSTQDVGMYAALFQLGYYPISIATGMTIQFLAPIFFQRAGDGTDIQRNASVKRLSWQLTAFALGVTSIAFFLAYLLHRQIFYIFVSPEYRTVSDLLPWMVLSGGLFAASQTISLNLLSQTKTYVLLPVKIITALLGISLNLFGGYFYGTSGIVFASVFFSLSCLISFGIINQKSKKINRLFS
jgi:O-antigen/teichoic acid export membrane protein